MTQYQFTVNNITLTANLGWNANATLNALNITDGFNSAGTQNCTYIYDDLTRLTSTNCPGVAAQTFTYDPFGNINKAGSPNTFNASYNAATNRISLVGTTFQPTYDNNGNVTNDSFHTYTWDADGHPVTIDAGYSDAVSLAYDALGRMVEQTRGSAYTQIAYSPLSQKLALMNGQTLQKAMVPLTGKALAIYNSGGVLYYAHSDLLGSIRLGTTPARARYFDTAYAPFGETYASAGSLDPSYTGQTNDTSSYRQDTAGGLYDFPLREYSTQGRWPNPDPLGRIATCPKDPQTQNRYAYVRNNPMTYTDPTGGIRGMPCDPFFDPFCGACDDPEDPYCDPCILNPFLCYPPVGGGGFIGGGGNPEKPRPFPWLLLPPGFFESFGNSSGGSSSRANTCAKKASKVLIDCLVAGSLVDAAAVGICVGACALTGPGWPVCAAACGEAGLIVEDAVWEGCFTAAVILFVACELTPPRFQSGVLQ